MRDYQTKKNDPDVADNIAETFLGANELNSLATEAKTAVASADLTLADAAGTAENTTQLAQALSIYGGGGAIYYVDTGDPGAYKLTLEGGRIPTTEGYYNGMTALFTAGTSNPGAATVTVSLIGVVAITDVAGDPLTGGELTTDGYSLIVYFDGAFLFLNNFDNRNVVTDITGQSGVISITGTDAIPIVNVVNGGIDTIQQADDSITLAKLSESSTESLNVRKRVCTAWGDWNGITGARNDDLNITSFTINASPDGNYSIIISPSMDSDNYVVVCGGSRADDGTGSGQKGFEVYDKATNGFKIQTWSGDSNKTDFENVSFAIFGDET